MPEYEEWKKTASPGWTIKYYKGLGTSDKKEAQEYFAAIDDHRKSFVYEGDRLYLLLGSLSCSLSQFHSSIQHGLRIFTRAIVLS